jgi:hypothetical protein
VDRFLTVREVVTNMIITGKKVHLNCMGE